MNTNRAPKPNPLGATHAGGGDHSDDPAAALALQIVAQEEDRALRDRVLFALNGDNLHLASRRLGLSYYTLRRISLGSRPKLDVLRRVCRVYLVDGHWLLTGEGSRHHEDRAREALRSVPSELLMAEFTRRLARVLNSSESSSTEEALRRGQAALDTLRAELPQAP